MQTIYLDNNATTQLDPRVAEAMQEVLLGPPLNPSSMHAFGKEGKKLLSNARETIASYLSVTHHEILFTSGGTEALHTAILGLKPPHPRIVSTCIEHAAVYSLLEQLEISGRPVTFLPVKPTGELDLGALEQSLTEDVGLLVIGAANSETGTIQPLEEIAQIAHERGIPLIVDGIALLGKEPIVLYPGITAMAFAGHKCHGPQGVGCLYVKRGTKLSPLFYGGHQEGLRRAGTENLAGIVGLARAIEIIQNELSEARSHMFGLRKTFESALIELLPNATVHGGPTRLCNTTCCTFPDLDGETLLMQLDLLRVAASMGSACTAGSLEPSRVLLNMGLSRELARKTLRFSMSRMTTLDDINQAINRQNQAISAQRHRAP